MAGHSKWANIKHRKARQDAVKGKAWSKCSRAIMVAVKNGGPDPDTNLTLRYAILDAKSVNMPKDTIQKAIAKASGEGSGGAVFQEIRYEGYGANGVAIIIDCLTDNVQRTAPDLRHAFEKHGGNLAKPGAVAFGFQTKGVILIEASAATEDQLVELALEAGAEDVTEGDGGWEITSEPSEFVAVLKAVEDANIETVSAEITMIPDLQVKCDADTARKVMTLVEIFEDHDDVQKVYTNADIPDEVMASLDG
ncbi:MAG: YebC/PmpR family DNA-binding transcriptional regulator [Phycisphaerae bacterium]|nr:YebC/PmpR family DNA-binding transcriptional regulator [Phycisphaerae bacterium]|tara:strand:- start:185 stop:937 length:753 start_codon:yes stop_codon:yes gene_type:complete